MTGMWQVAMVVHHVRDGWRSMESLPTFAVYALDAGTAKHNAMLVVLGDRQHATTSGTVVAMDRSGNPVPESYLAWEREAA